MKPYQFFLIVSFALPNPSDLQGVEPVRVTTRVYSGEKSRLVHHNETLFSQNRVYDFTIVGSDIVTIYDHEKSASTLLNPKRKTQTTVSLSQIDDYVSMVHDRSKNLPFPKHVTAFLQRDYQEEWEAATDHLTLSGGEMTYRARLVTPESQEVIQRYRKFADWSAKLNTILLGPPPDVRLQLNAAIFEKGRVPAEIHRTVRTSKNAIVARSIHTYQRSWTDEDRSRVDLAEDARRSYTHVSLDQFRPDLGAAKR